MLVVGVAQLGLRIQHSTAQHSRLVRFRGRGVSYECGGRASEEDGRRMEGKKRKIVIISKYPLIYIYLLPTLPLDIVLWVFVSFVYSLLVYIFWTRASENYLGT